MLIELLNDNQLRCVLSSKDLSDRHLQVSELAYGNEKTKQLFHELLYLASCEVDFHTDDLPLMIEAIPMPEDSLLLLFTKVEYPEELDTRFSDFTDSGDYIPQTDDDDPPTLEGSEAILSLIKRLSAQAAAEAFADKAAPHTQDSFVPLKDTAQSLPASAAARTEAPSDVVRMFSVRDLSDLLRLAHVLRDLYDEDNSLYFDAAGSAYYLFLHKGHHTPDEFNRVCNILSEYALQYHYTPSTEAYFCEHMKCIAAHDALCRLAQL